MTCLSRPGTILSGACFAYLRELSEFAGQEEDLEEFFESLVPRARDLPSVVAAAHQAYDTLVQLAAADHDLVSRAARAGRLYSPPATCPPSSTSRARSAARRATAYMLCSTPTEALARSAHR